MKVDSCKACGRKVTGIKEYYHLTASKIMREDGMIDTVNYILCPECYIGLYRSMSEFERKKKREEKHHDNDA